MSWLIPFYYDPLVKYQCLFDDAFIVRFWPPLSMRGVRRASANPRHPDLFRPRTDVQESKDWNTITVTFEVPGLRLKDVVIQLQDNRLTVSSEHKISNAVEEDGHTICEHHYCKFFRTVQLPNGTKLDDVKAELENDLLTVTFPKTVLEQLPQRKTV